MHYLYDEEAFEVKVPEGLGHQSLQCTALTTGYHPEKAFYDEACTYLPTKVLSGTNIYIITR